MKSQESQARYPGILKTGDGNAAVVAMETAASEAAGAYAITPASPMGEGWADAAAAGAKNVNGRSLLHFEAEGEHAAAGVTAGMSLVGLRSANFASGQGLAYMHESLYAAVGKRLTYVLNVACRAMTKQALNIYAGHDDYHAIDDTGCFQLFAADVQQVADLNLVAHRIAELSLNPGVCAQDGFLTSHVVASYLEPERELIREYLGDPADVIKTPTAAQRAVFGDTRRRIPELYDFDYPSSTGVVQNSESYAQGVAAQRPFYFDHIPELADRAFAEFEELTGRKYARAMTHRLEDADYVFVGQGSVVRDAEAVADYLREHRRLKVGVLNLTMFRPFPADLVSTLLSGKKGVVVLERTDQPLAVELPMIREIRASLAQAAENGRARAGRPGGGRRLRKRAPVEEIPLPYPKLLAIGPDQVPDLYSGCYGLGGRDLQPSDLLAAIENMAPEGAGRRKFYLGIDFIDEDTELPKVQIRQESVLADYPQLRELVLQPSEELLLNTSESIELRIHSIGGWDAAPAGNSLASAAAALFGMHVKAFPTRIRERRGQPTIYSAVLSQQAVRLNGDLKHVDVVIAHDGAVFRHSDPLEGMRDGGILLIQSDLPAEALWESFPQAAQWGIRERNIRVCSVDAAGIAMAESVSLAERYRLQGLAFMGAFFNVASLLGKQGLTRESVFDGLRAYLANDPQFAGDAAIEDAVHACMRGFDEVRALDPAGLEDSGRAAKIPLIPVAMSGAEAAEGPGNQGAFWDQVCAQYKTGHDVLADPFTAISAIPAATSSMRDMSTLRTTVPRFVADKCTGCSKCWVQCPDSAIPGVVSSVEEVLDSAVRTVANAQNPLTQFAQLIRHLAREIRKLLAGDEFESFGVVLSKAYETVAEKSKWDDERRAAYDAEFEQVFAALEHFPLAKTAPFFDVPENQEKGSGGLLSITINPETCKGCDVCVAVCDDGALVTVPQTDQEQQQLQSNWDLWKNLPETDDRFLRISSLEEGIGMMPSLLLKQRNYMSMLGGDNACMGCGEKTAIHLVLSAVNALMVPRVEAHLEEITQLINSLDEKARKLLASETDLGAVSADGEALEVPLERGKKETVARIHKAIEALNDLKWRYEKGPGGRGRANMGFANSTGCTSIWGATYPFNPYPFPWTSHLFQDSPSVAVGLFEGHMRKMADGFIALRRAQKLLDGRYDAEADEAFFGDFDWQQFSDDEFALCPPLFAVGGDGAMMDIGLQNLSRLMTSGKPVRVVVVDTQASSAGGQGCSAGFSQQAPDAFDAGPDRHHSDTGRKELGLIAMAHRGVFVMQSSQATPSHLFGNLIKGLQLRRPALFILNAPCPREWGIAQDSAPEAARLALESRAMPNLVFDPEQGTTFSECLDLEGNPAPDDNWPEHELLYLDDEGEEQRMRLPLTIADWALGEKRFRDHYRVPAEDADLVPFHEYLEMDAAGRLGCEAFIYMVDAERCLQKMGVSAQIVELAEERQRFWAQLRELSGIKVSGHLSDVVGAGVEKKMQRELAALKTDYEAKFARLTREYPQLIARRMAEGLLRAGGHLTVSELMEQAEQWEGPAFQAPEGMDFGAAPGVETKAAEADSPEPAVEEPEVAVAEEEEDEDFVREPWIDSIRCTSCDDCINLNPKMFGYNEDGLAYILDPRAGTFKELVTAAEKCAPSVIHPGDPLNPDEKGLDKLIARAEKFN